MASAERLIEVFNEAKARPAGAERDHFLSEACQADPELKEQVLSLLQAHDGAGSFLEHTQVIPPASPLTEKPGDRIGRYKLLQQIGEGGCGVVYMAEQEEPVRRRVAFKVIKLGMDTRQVVARFEAERQALALMDHPNIAKVFDAGATSTGRPYFVMELVRGVKLTDYCDENKVSTADRLELFILVCQAIQHAHQKGVIHRDIKPSNILVTVNDGVPVPKVIDFGIAKAIEQRLTDKTLFTAFEQFIGTPAYMSPEQAEVTSLDIDTRADIYSLGVLLYELLSGNTPFDAEKLVASGVAEIRRIIREQEPPKPSTRLNTLNDADLSTVAQRRHTDPPKLIHQIRGDLDWIVMKCLEKDRKRRYETANGLAVDIQRHLANEPVTARPPGKLYRFQKLVHRHKLAFAAGTAIAAALVLGTAVSTWQAIRATRAEHHAEASRATEVEQRKIAEAARASEAAQRKVAEDERTNAEKQRELAEANFQKARDTVDKYFTLVSESTLLEAPGLQPLRLQLLEAARQYYEGFLQQKSDDPEIQAEMAAIHGRLSLIYAGLDRNEDAVSALLESLRIAEKLVTEHPDNKEFPRRLAGTFKGSKGLHKSARAPRDPANALVILQKGAALWETFARDNPSLPGFRSDLVTIYTITGDGLRGVGQWDLARTNLQRAFEVSEQLLLEYPAVREYEGHFVYAYTRLAGLLNNNGRKPEAEQVFRRAFQVLAKLVADHPNLPGYRADLGRAYGHLAHYLRAELGKYDEAEKLYLQAREMLELLATDSPADGENRSVLSSCYRGLALVQSDLNRPSEAELTFRKALAIVEPLVRDFPAVPDYRLELAGTLMDLAQLLRGARPQDAEIAYRQAIPIHEQLVADFPTVDSYQLSLLESQVRLITLLQNTGQLPEAEKLYRLAIARLQSGAAANPGMPQFLQQLARLHNRLGNLLRNNGRKQEADLELRKAQELWRAYPDPAIEQARQAAESLPNDLAIHRWQPVIDGYYNFGEWEKCLWSIRKKEQVLGAIGWKFSAWEGFPAAMAHWQLDHQEEARIWFHRSIDWMDDAQESRLRERQAEAASLLGLPDPGEKSRIAAIYFKQGDASRQKGELVPAKEAYDHASDLYKLLVADFPLVPAYQKKLTDLINRTGQLSQPK